MARPPFLRKNNCRVTESCPDPPRVTYQRHSERALPFLSEPQRDPGAPWLCVLFNYGRTGETLERRRGWVLTIASTSPSPLPFYHTMLQGEVNSSIPSKRLPCGSAIAFKPQVRPGGGTGRRNTGYKRIHSFAYLCVWLPTKTIKHPSGRPVWALLNCL